ARLYQNIWTEDGSPLLVYSHSLATALRGTLSEQFVIEVGMRYGNPSIGAALERLRAAGAERIVALPLYPQYAESSYETAVRALRQAAQALGCAARLELLPPFYDRADFIAACAARLQEQLRQHTPEHLVFSYHSLPVRHLKR